MPAFESATLGMTIDESSLETLTGPQLRLVHQEITKNPTGKFASRAVGIERVRKALAGLQAGEPNPDPDGICSAGGLAIDLGYKAKKPRKPRQRKLMDLAPRTADCKSVKAMGSKRAKLMALFAAKGFTNYAEIKEATGWDVKYARDNVWFLNRLFGVGIKEQPEGTFHQVS
jgi:hypothetical protein